MRCISERDICAKGMANQAEFVWIGASLRAGSLDCSGDVERFQSSIGLLSFARADATKIET